MLKVLGIESSCDETSASVVCDAEAPEERVLSNIVRSQTEVHAPYGGVVPELSSRAHIDVIDPIIQQAMEKANTEFNELDAIAVTAGPGLIGGVIVGVMTAKGLAAATDTPFIGVNHLEGHALTVRMTHDVEFPYLLLLVSGGHCQLLLAKGLGEYKLLGQTLDDALGEAFDKTAKMLGLGYPGGPAVERLARDGNREAYDLPRPLIERKDSLDFSFSGLKTAILHTIEREKQSLHTEDEKERFKKDLCASFHQAVEEVLESRIANAIAQVKQEIPQLQSVVLSGGVAANQFIRNKLETVCADADTTLVAPPLSLCTDNGAMIAWAGLERFRAGETHALTVKPRARWPLNEMTPV